MRGIDPMKCLSLILAFVLALQSSAAARDMTTTSDGESNRAQEAPQTTRLKAEVQKRGVGARVRVTMRNGSQLKGHISTIDDTFFEVTDQTEKPARITYADAQKVQGPGLSKGAKIGIVAGVAVAVTAIVIAVAAKSAGY